MQRNTTLLLLGIVSFYQHDAAARVHESYWTLQSVRDPRGVVVSQIDIDTPPYLVGFRRGDVLLSINGEASNLKSKLETLWTLETLKNLGNRLAVKVMREGKPLEVQFTNDECFLTTSSGERLLLEARSNADLRKCSTHILDSGGISWLFKGLKSHQVVPAFSQGQPVGLKLYGVPPQPHGFKIGDIIHHVNGHSLLTTEDAFTIERNLEGARKFEVGITRDGTEQTIRWTE